MKITETAARAAMLKYLEDNKPRRQQPHEITIAELAVMWGCSLNKAEKWLKNAVAAGEWDCHEKAWLHNGKVGAVYWMKGGEK